MSSLDTSLGVGAVSKRDLWCAPALPEWDVQTGGSCRCSVEHLWCDCDTLMLTSHVSRRLWTPFNLPISLALHIFLSHGLSPFFLFSFISWHLFLSVSFCLCVVWASLTHGISDPPSGQLMRAGLGHRGTIPLRWAKAVWEDGGQALLHKLCGHN